MSADLVPEAGPQAARWEPWSPAQVAEGMSGCPCLWGIAGGWAIDLWLGRRTRPHGDIEIVASRSALAAVLDRFPGLHSYKAEAGLLTPLGDVGAAAAKQVWLLDPEAGKWRLDVMLDPGDEACWIYRRDPRIHAPRAALIGRSEDGIPFLKAAATLLFKAKAPRPKDELDLAASLPRLAPDEREWLARSLAAAHPDSPWLARVQAAAAD